MCFSHSPTYRWTEQECNIEETSEEEEPPSKSSKDKKANGPDSGKGASLIFKITSKVQYKTVLKGTLCHIIVMFLFSKGRST